MRPYTGQLPSFLYRFRPVDELCLEKLAFEIRDSGVYLSALSDFNDPEEGRPIIRYLGPRNDIESLLKSNYLQQHPNASDSEVKDFINTAYTDIRERGFSLRPDMIETYFEATARLTRVACFSETPYNSVMWSHYSSYKPQDKNIVPHGGICLQYFVDDSWRDLLRPVSYQNHRPTLNRLTVVDPSDLVFVKGTDWDHEREWRIVQFFDAKDINHPKLNEYSKLKVDPYHLSGIIFGVNTPMAFKKICKDWVQNRDERPKFYQCLYQELDLKLSIAEYTF